MLKRNKTIILVIDSLEIGGAEKSILDLQKKLLATHDVKILVFKGRVEKYPLQKHVVYIKSRRIFSINTIFGLINEIHALRKSKNIFISFAPEVAVLVNLALFLSLKKRNSRSLVSFRNSPKYYQNHRNLYKYLLHCAAVQFCDACHFLTSSNAIEYQTLFDKFSIGKTKKKFVIPNYLRNYHPVKNFYKDKKTIIFVGRLNLQKQPLDFVKFVRILEQAYPNEYQYKMLGDGILRETVEAQIFKENLSSKISILGKVENIDEYYSEASHMILTSDFEGHPGAIFEAIQAGVRVITYPYDHWICEIFSKLHCSHTSLACTPESLLETFIAQKKNSNDEKLDILTVEKELNEHKLTTSWSRLFEQL